jgi:hypothetical protein
MEIACPRGRFGAPTALGVRTGLAGKTGVCSKACALAAVSHAEPSARAGPLCARPLSPCVVSAGSGGLAAAAPIDHANEMSWFLSGTERMRLPVAAKNALSTAGAATKIVGSPTPPQKSPDGMMIDSTLGISLIRIEL